MTYLPDRLNAKGVRWNYDGCPGLGTDDLMRPGTYSPARGLPRTPERLTAGRRPVRSGYIVGTRAAAVAEAIGIGRVTQAMRPWGMTVYVEGRKASAKTSPKRPTDESPMPNLDGTTPIVLSDHDLMAKLGIRPVGYLD